MLNISKQQAQQRLTILPPILKEALFSGENADELYYICKENQLDDEQMSDLSMIVGDVIFGFLSLDNLQQEIKNNLKLDDIKARTIEREINQKVFAHLRGDLEKNYNPVLPEEEKNAVPAAPAQIPSRPIVQGGTMPHVPMQKSFRDFIKRKPGEAVPETSTPKIESKPVIDLGSFEIKHANSAPSPTAPETQKRPYESAAAPAAPFILHQHNQQEIQQAPIKRFSIKPELNVKVEDYYQSPEPKKSAISARIELPQMSDSGRSDLPKIKQPQFQEVGSPKAASSPQPINNSKTRVVHYDGYSTPLNGAGLPKNEQQNKINLSALPTPRSNSGQTLFSSPQKTSSPAVPQIRTQEIPKENKVDLRKFSKPDENTIDLRKKS